MRVTLTTTQKKKQIYSADDIYAIMHPMLMQENETHRRQEYFWIIGIDTDRCILFIELLGLGASNRLGITMPEVYRMAIYKMADNVMFVHNHPTGRLNPSPEDETATCHMIKAGELLDIGVIDHLIISEKGYYSFLKEGLMNQLRDSNAFQVMRKEEVELLKLKERVSAQQEMAIKMLEVKLPIEQIMALTDLKKPEIQKLAKKLQKA